MFSDLQNKISYHQLWISLFIQLVKMYFLLPRRECLLFPFSCEKKKNGSKTYIWKQPIVMTYEVTDLWPHQTFQREIKHLKRCGGLGHSVLPWSFYTASGNWIQFSRVWLQQLWWQLPFLLRFVFTKHAWRLNVWPGLAINIQKDISYTVWNAESLLALVHPCI